MIQATSLVVELSMSLIGCVFYCTVTLKSEYCCVCCVQVKAVFFALTLCTENKGNV